MQIINTNLNSLMSRNALAVHSQSTEQATERLSSGKRINRASDDAAGLAISERMTSDVRGTAQGIRNAVDGISMIKTAEGALSQNVTMLHRMRELTIQAANGVNSAENVAVLQAEVDQISAGIRDLVEDTTFNGQRVLADAGELSGNGELEFYLENSWMPESQALIEEYYGLDARGIDITLNYTTSDGPGGTLASVGSLYNASFKGSTSLSLNIDSADFPNTGYPTGDGPIKQDRVIAHEMVHAVMAANMDLGELSYWFTEGSAEFIHGADDRVQGDFSATLMNTAINTGTPNAGDPSPAAIDYSRGYVAVRMLHEEVNGGIKAVMQFFAQAGNTDMDDMFSSLTGFANEAAFVTHVQANGDAFIANEMTLSDNDTGSIHGSDFDGAVKNDIDVLSNAAFTDEKDYLVLKGQTVKESETVVGLQLGGESRVEMDKLFVNATAMSAEGVDLNFTKDALQKIDGAIELIGEYQGTLGAMQNRLQHSVNNLAVFQEQTAAARSRIEDADFAAESAELSRSQVLTQAAQAMLAQSNSRPQQVLALLQ